MQLTQRTNLYRELVKYPEIVSFLKGPAPLQDLFELLPLAPERMALYRELYAPVGHTPVSILPLPGDNRLYVKRECENGMGNNHYSRYWLVHLALAEAFGLIRVGESTLLEITSGSSGISLSMACEALGFKLRIIIPEHLPKGRVDAMTRPCTTIVKVPGYIGRCRDFFLQEKDKADYYLPNHSEEKSNLISDVFARVAHEFIGDHGPVDHVLLGLGNGSSTYGIAKVFKTASPACDICSFYPSPQSNKVVYGLYADNLTFKHINMTEKETLIDRERFIDDISMDRVYQLFASEPIVRQWGHSSLYALNVATQLAEKCHDETFFSIAYDKIERYAND
jgi:cysteine synthase